MKPLPQKFTKYGFDYQQLKRQGLIALFQKKKPEHKFSSYEVIRIQQNEACVILGDHVEAAEGLPNNDLWGTHGWSYSHNDLQGAEKKFEELCKNPEQTKRKISLNLK